MAAALQIIGTIGQTVAGIRSAMANERAEKVRARQATVNAEFEARRVEDRNRRILAKQRASGAAAGVEIDSGSPLELLIESAKQGELDRVNVLRGGEIRSRDALRNARLARGGIGASIFGGLAQTGSILGDMFARSRGFSFS